MADTHTYELTNGRSAEHKH